MRLEDIERLAARELAGRPSPATNAAPIVDLARAVLAMLPVIRAADQWRTTRNNPFDLEGTREHRQDCFALQNAIDTLRAAMEEK